MAYLVVADIPDHTVRSPLGFRSYDSALTYLVNLAVDAEEDGFATSFEESGGILHVHDGVGGVETYRIIESSDEKVLRMAHVAPPSEYRPPSLP